MNPNLSLNALTGISIILLLLFAFFIKLAWSQREKSWTLGGFFLGGRNIGANLTEHSTWGTSFSLANGIFYFSVLGFNWGLAAIWVQIPWTISIFILGLLVPRIILVTQKHTIHGFIGELYGPRSRIIASVVTTFGFLGAYSFEIYVSIQIMCKFINMPELNIPLAIIFSLFCAAYCEIGGFSAAATMDKRQNTLGLIAVLVIVYLIFRLSNPRISHEALQINSLKKSLLDFSNIPVTQLIGILCMASFTNLVDMSNWQNIAANGDSPKTEHKMLTRSIFKAGILAFFFPAFFGVFFGYIFRGMSGVGEQDILPNILSIVYPNAGFIGGIFLGIIMISLLSTALSTSNSYLLSSVQTITWDLKEHDNIKEYDNPRDIPNAKQRVIVQRARRYLYIIAILSVSIFSALVQWNAEKVFAFQFVIFGSIIALVPVVLFGLWFNLKNLKPSIKLQTLGFWSLTIGFFSGLIPSGVYLFNSTFNIYAWSPIVTLLSSSSIFIIGYMSIKQKWDSN